VGEVNGLRSVEAIESIGGGDPEEAVLILYEAGDDIAAEPFCRGELFYKMRYSLCYGGNGEDVKDQEA
jgi:hypothetical protein